MKSKLDFEEYLDSLASMGNSAKSATALVQSAGAVDGEIIGTGRSDYTQDVSGYVLHAAGKEFALYDVPGIEGDESKFEEIIQKAVNKAHLIFYVSSDTKRIEPKTAEKIKKYLRNDTDVYSIINVHLPPKAKRDAAIDGTYQEEEAALFKKDSDEIKPQTESTLKKVLGENYKSGFLVNGLQSFCACAFNKNWETTIIPDTDEKTLRATQKKFVNEYSGNIDGLKRDSRICDVAKIIESHAQGFESFIVESNKKKLLARLTDSYQKISGLRKNSIAACGKFSELYREMENSVSSAAENFTSFLRRGYIENSVSAALDNLTAELFDIIERREGKMKSEDYQYFLQSHEQKIKESISKSLKEKFDEAVQNFKDAVSEAQKRFGEDAEDIAKFADLNFPELSSVDFDDVAKEMNFSLQDFGGAALKVGSLVLSGVLAGMAVGNIVGAVIGGILGAIGGILFAIKDFFTSREKRIAKAKSRVREIFGELSDEISSGLERNFQSEKYSESVNSVANQIAEKCEAEIAKFSRLENSLENLVELLQSKIKMLKGVKYGEL